MLNRADIRRECRREIFEEGELLYERGAVKNLGWQVKEEDGFEVVCISAGVSGSLGEVYQVRVKADEDYREILECECTCPDFPGSSGLCKHCVAMMLSYLSERESGRRRSRLPAAGQQAKGQLQAPVRTSTYGFEGILGQYGLRDKVSLLQPSLQGKVRLEPYFRLRSESLTVEFKIGTGRMYVLKNLGDFVNAVARSERVSYGKELEFYHHEEAFAPECRPLVRFLQFTLLKGSSYMGNYLSAVYRRELAVNGDLADDFLESVKELGLYGETAWEERRQWQLSCGEPERLLEITGDEAGISVRLQEMGMLTGRRYVYFFEKGTIWKLEREKVEEVREFLLYMDSFGKSGLYVAKSELPAFSRDMLPVLQSHFRVQMKNYDPARFLPEEVCFELYLDSPQKDMLTCSLYGVYGEEKYNLFETPDLSERRDAKRELQMSGLVSSFFTAYDPQRHQMAITREEEIYDFLKEGLPRLQELCEVYVSDAVKAMRILPSPHVNVGISLGGDLLELTLSSEEMPLDQLISILSRYDKKRKYYRLRDGSFVDLSDEGIRVLSGIRDSCGIREEELAQGKAVLPRYRAMYLDSRLQEGGRMSLVKDKSFRALVRNMKTVEDSDYELPTGLKGILRGYQKTGFLWIRTLRANGFGGILADDMGLGKTLQVIAFLLSEWEESGGKTDGPALVVCPASLVYNWQSEVERFAPALPVFLAAGSAADRQRVLEEVAEKNGGVLVTSYELLRRDIEQYQRMHFSCQIIDEAQFIKNHTTQAARAVKKVDSSFRLALTGTPVENRLSELWSIFDYLMPGFLFSYSRFREELEAPIVSREDGNAAERLQKMIRPFVLRRLKKDVLSDLPEKIEKNMYAVLEGEQKELYEAHVQRLVQMLSGQSEKEFAAARIQVLSELTRLRQLCCDPALLYEGYQGGSAKTRLCLELIRNATDGGHKVLLFSQFTSQLARLKEAMAGEGISFCSLEGSTPKARRLELAEQFNRDATQVFCISLKAGGTGLNLTGADMVIHFDPWWNVAVQNQATDRAHRIGQTSVVTVYKLIARGTIEEKIVRLQEKKRDLAEQILGQEEMGLSSLTREALMEILQDEG